MEEKVTSHGKCEIVFLVVDCLVLFVFVLERKFKEILVEKKISFTNKCCRLQEYFQCCFIVTRMRI